MLFVLICSSYILVLEKILECSRYKGKVIKGFLASVLVLP